jgi:hypothetical protein
MCCVIASSTISRRTVGGIESTSTEAEAKPRARVSVCFVGRVGSPMSRIWDSVTARRSNQAVWAWWPSQRRVTGSTTPLIASFSE